MKQGIRMERERPSSALFVSFVAAALGAPLVSCSDGAEAGAGASVGEARYLIAARVTLPDGRRTHLIPVPSLDEGMVYGLERSVEAIDGWAFGRSGEASFWHAGQREPTITRWTVNADGSFARGAVLSLANLGMNQTGGARRSVFVAPDRAYFIEETHPEEVVIWNPEAMTLIATIPLGVEALDTFVPRALLVGQGSRLLASVYWRNDDSTTWADHVRLIEIDPVSDIVVASTDDGRCGSLMPTGATADGTFYFAAESGSAPIRSLLGDGFGYPPCVLRVPPAGAGFDPSFSPDLSALAGGRPVGAVLMLDERSALMDVWHPEEVSALAPDGTNWNDVRREPAFRRWRWDVDAGVAEPVAGAPAVASGSLDDFRRFQLDGDHFISELQADASANVTSKLLPTGETRQVFSGPGQVVGIVRLR